VIEDEEYARTGQEGRALLYPKVGLILRDEINSCCVNRLQLTIGEQWPITIACVLS